MKDQPDLKKFLRKDYRDGYMQTQVRAGIAYQFQALRKKFRLNQNEMAERIGKPQSTVSRLENVEYGRVSVQTLLDIASSLDIALIVQFSSYPDFLKRTDDMTEGALQVDTIYESKTKNDLSLITPSAATHELNTFSKKEKQSAADSNWHAQPQFYNAEAEGILSPSMNPMLHSPQIQPLGLST